MTWPQLITMAEARLRYHLECRHLDPWNTEHRQQHYRGARRAIRDLRLFQLGRALERSKAVAS